MSKTTGSKAITVKSTVNSDSVMKLDYLGAMGLDNSQWAKLISNPKAEIMNLKSLKRSLEVTPPITVMSQLTNGNPQTTTLNLIIMVLDESRKGDDFYEDLFIIACRNFIYLGGETGVIGTLSLLMHTYPKILTTLRTLCPKLGINLVIGSLYESLEAKQDELFHHYQVGTLKFVDPQNFKLSKEERYAITNLYVMALTKRIGDQGRSWIDTRISAYKSKKSNIFLDELYNIDSDSWNDVYDYMSSVHNLRAVILDKYLEYEPGMSPNNTTLRTTRVLMRWSGCAHLSAIDQVMTSATPEFTVASERWYKNEMALYRYYRSELNDAFPYCRLLLTIESSDAIGRKVVAEFASYCNHFASDKSTLQNVTRPSNDQEAEITSRAANRYKSVMEQMDETTID